MDEKKAAQKGMNKNKWGEELGFLALSGIEKLKKKKRLRQIK